MKKKIKCLVMATNANGEPDVFQVMVECSVKQYDTGFHYDAAREAAEQAGYEPKLVMDENDAGGRMLIPHLNWDNVAQFTRK